MPEKTVGAANLSPKERSVVQKTLEQLYYGSGSRGQNLLDLMDFRRGAIGQLSEREQMAILADRELYSIRDKRGLTPLHDLAARGTENAQRAIVIGEKTFDKEEFMSRLGRPLDVLAVRGSLPVQLELLKLPSEKLTEERRVDTNITTLLHELASDPFNTDLMLGILALPKELVMTADKDGETVLDLIKREHNKKVEQQVRELG